MGRYAMDFEIDQARFISALTLAQTVADRRSTMPVLANVLLRATGDGLVVSATDMTIAITATVPCEVAALGSCSVGARHLGNVVRTLRGQVRVRGLPNSWANISAARAEFKLMGLPEGDFPSLPDPSGVEFTEVPGHKLVDLIDKTLFSVSTDEARVNLNGALLESDGETMGMVSTDGHRLTRYSLPLAGPKFPTGIIVPRKGLEEMRKVLHRKPGSCRLGVSGQFLFIQSDALTLSVKLNQVTFPPWRQVVPGEQGRRRVPVGREELASALRQAAVIAPEKTATVQLRLDSGSLRLLADNPELGAIAIEMSVEDSGPQLSAGFNANYLLDALGAVDTDQVYLDFQGELDPVVIRPALEDGEGPDFFAVVMPMRI